MIKDYKEIDNVEDAEYWIPTEDKNNINSNVTIGQFYGIYEDFYDNELVIKDDKGCNSTIYLAHNGIFVTSK